MSIYYHDNQNKIEPLNILMFVRKKKMEGQEERGEVVVGNENIKVK